MTTTTPAAAAPTPAPSALLGGEPTAVVLATPGSQGTFRILAAIYLALIAFAWLPIAAGCACLLPLFCTPQHPRRALWLWTVGLVAGGMSMAKGWHLLQGVNGQAWTTDPAWGGIGVALMLVGVGLIGWHLRWVKSPRRM